MFRAKGIGAKLKTIFTIFVLAISPLFSANSVSVLAATKASSESVPSGGDFYDDVPEAGDAPLGAAQYFHIFSNKTKITAHVNGNISTGEFDGQVNFGTNIIQGLVDQDINYFQNIENIANSSFVDSGSSDARTNKVVVGDNVAVGLENQNTVYLENSKMDHLAADEIYQDPSNDETYINIKKELSEDKTQGEKWATKEDSKNVTYDDSDQNNREIKITPDEAEEGATYSVELTKVDEQGNPLEGAVFDLYEEGSEKPVQVNLTTDENGKITLDNLTSIGDYYFVETKAPAGYKLDGVKHYFKVTIASQTSKSDYVYYNLDAAELEKDRPLKISGISSDGPSIIVNVDLKGRSELDIKSKIVPVIDENDRHNQETEDFADAKILFNFYNSKDTQIVVNRPFSGTMLAPEANIVAYQNVDGSLIANDVNVVGGETHRWDFQSAFQTGDGVPAELTVTNSKEETAETVKVDGNKKWIDGNNSERPKKIIVDLYQNGQQIDYREITAEDNWHYSFDNLPKYDENGDEYLYTVKEWKVPGYVTGVDTDDNITNTLATSISGKKIWVDSDDAAGKRPTSVKVDLYQNGIQIDSQEVTGKGNEWPYNFANLPKYDAEGKEYVYTVKEETVPGYTQTQNGLDITNTIEPEVTPEPETTTVSGTKTWVDNDNSGQTRPDSITVHLYQNGELFKSQDVTATNNWQYSFTDLPKYDENGAEYEYTIGEDAVPGYTSDRDGNDLTNTLEETTEPEKTEISGTKTWVGDDETSRPKSITIELYRNGEPIGSKQVTAADNWQYSFTNLDKHDANGNEYTYTVKEANVPDDYASEQIGTDFVNTYIAEETTEISGTKIWEDNNNASGSRPDQVTVQLYRNGTAVDKQTQTVSAADNWQYHFTGLEKYDPQGEPYVYTVKETDLPNNYDVTYDGFDIVNTLKKTSISGTKTWDDNNNEAGVRPDSIFVKLLQNDQVIASREVSADENGNWHYEFTDLDQYDTEGKEYQYQIEEEPVKYYTQDGDGVNLTNKLAREVDPVEDVVNIRGRKIWADKHDAQGKRPESITVNLYRNGEKIDSREVTAADNWRYEFTSLPKHDDHGNAYQYTVKEVGVPSDYTSTQFGYIFVNRLKNQVKPGAETTTISGQKTWVDHNDAAQKRPTSITIELYRNGVKVGAKQVSAQTNWQYEFTDLPKNDAQGQAYQYTVKEVAVPGYTTSQSGNNFTNTLKETKPTESEDQDKDKPTQEQQDKQQPSQKLPQAGEADHNNRLIIAGFIMLLTVILGLAQFPFKKQD